VTSIGSGAFSYAGLAEVFCYVAPSAFTGSSIFTETPDGLVIRVPSTGAVSDAWPDLSSQTFQGNNDVTVIKNL